MADFNLGRMKFVWQGAWGTGTNYVKDDVVRKDSNSYICLLAHESGTWSTDLAANKWELMIPGNPGSVTTTDGDMIYNDGGSDVRLPIGTSGQALIVDDTGHPAWTALATAQSIYYVKVDGDDSNNGTNLNEAFRTIRHACATVTGPATIYVKGGLYYEVLPLKVPANVTIVGDGQRTTGVAPVNITNNSATILATTGSQTTTKIVIDTSANVGGAWQINDTITISNITSGGGISGTVTITNIEYETPSSLETRLTVSFSSQAVSLTDCTISSDHSEGTMWMLRDGATLNKMYFRGMEGWAPNLTYPEDVTQATIKAVFVALDPDHPIVNKSPYVIECAAFSDTGAIGAIVDGDLHGSGIKSMVFHGYTIVASDGVGYWVKGQGKAEIVSCFTYYNWVGYTTTGGGKIRALNGNNSYGTYGVISRGYDADETAIGGAIYGNQIEYNPLSLVGEFLVGNTITGGTSGATGTITNVQTAVNKIYYVNTNGNSFQAAETITASGGKSAVIATDGATGQKGFVIVADGFAEEPRPGGSISITGDSYSYVIQSVSGAYANSSSVLTIVLANEKASPSINNTTLQVRYNYSNARLTGHDFLSIGTGDKTTTNYPGEPTQASSQANEVIESFPGRVFYVSTDQDGNFRVGDYFRVDQATGRATLNASAFDLSGLTSLRLGSLGAQLGELVNEFSSDYTLSGDSNEAVPTEAAVRGYFENIATDVVPVDDDTLTLGTSTKRWNHLYVGDGSITIGNVKLSESGGSLVVKNANTDAPAPAAVSTISNGTSSVAVASNGAVTITTNGSLALTIASDGAATFAGNVTVNGGSTTLSSTNIVIDDTLLYMANNNPANLLDIGIVGHFTSGSYQHTGFVRDASDSVWKLFSGISTEPTGTVDFTGATYDALQMGAAKVSSVVLRGSSSGTVTLQAAATAGSATYTLPSADGTSGYSLKTDGSGTLSWAAAVTVSDDTSTNATYYPLIATATSGMVAAVKVASTKMTFNPSSGLLTVTALTESSSIALKENVNPITNALDIIMQLVGVTYDRKDGSKKNEAGLIAEDVATVLPNLVTLDENGNPNGINYTKFSAYLIEAVKSLKNEINELKGKI